MKKLIIISILALLTIPLYIYLALFEIMEWYVTYSFDVSGFVWTIVIPSLIVIILPISLIYSVVGKKSEMMKLNKIQIFSLIILILEIIFSLILLFIFWLFSSGISL